MTAKIIDFNGVTTVDIAPEKVIAALKDVEFDRILVIGFDTDGELYCSSHTSDLGAMLLMMERAKYFLLHDTDTRY